MLDGGRKGAMPLPARRKTLDEDSLRIFCEYVCALTRRVWWEYGAAFGRSVDLGEGGTMFYKAL